METTTRFNRLVEWIRQRIKNPEGSLVLESNREAWRRKAGGRESAVFHWGVAGKAPICHHTGVALSVVGVDRVRPGVKCSNCQRSLARR